MQLYGEDSEGNFGYRCPGESCDLFASSGGTFEERITVCLDCKRCSKPPLREGEKSTDLSQAVINRVLMRIENLYNEQTLFGNLDFEQIDFLEFELLKVWQAKVSEMERLFKIKTAIIFEALAAQSKR